MTYHVLEGKDLGAKRRWGGSPFIAGKLARNAIVVEKHIPQVDRIMHCPRHELRLPTSICLY
jgi:hypothetical protein